MKKVLYVFLVLVLTGLTGNQVKTICVQWDASSTANGAPPAEGYLFYRSTGDPTLPDSLEDVGNVTSLCRKENGIRRFWYLRAYRTCDLGPKACVSGLSNILDIKNYS